MSNAGQFPPLEPGQKPALPSTPASGNSVGLPAPKTSQDPEEQESLDPGWRTWSISFLLFVLTCASVAYVGRAEWQSPWQYAVSLMSILLAHELGHYVAARLHREPASPPFFLPFPKFSPFGTLGAVLFLGGRIRSRRALLDIGAAGPLAGLSVALPLMIVGLCASKVEPLPASYVQEGQSVLYMMLKRLILGPIPAGHDVTMHPILVAAWAGLLVTFLNLLPIGQLDGGHVAYSLLGQRHHGVARWLAWVPPAALVYNLIAFGLPAFQGMGSPEGLTSTPQFATLVSSISPWVSLSILVLVMVRWMGLEHPPVDRNEPLDPVRKGVAIVTLLFFVLLFMPSPWVVH